MRENELSREEAKEWLKRNWVSLVDSGRLKEAIKRYQERYWRSSLQEMGRKRPNNYYG